MKALLIADAPGHLLERIGKTWIDNAKGVEHSLLCSATASPYVRLRAGTQVDVTNWIDPLGFQLSGHAALGPQVVMVHHLTPEERTPMLAALRNADAVTTAARNWQEWLETHTGTEVMLIPHTVDAQHFVPAVNRAELRAAAEIAQDKFVIGFVGKASADAFGRKGLDVFLATLEQLAAVRKQLVVFLVGPGWETMSSRIEALGIRVMHKVYESTEQTVNAYQLMDALIVTASEEGGPCTILEAMACEVPVITSRVGHVPEIIESGVTGMITDSRTPAEYRSLFQSLWDNDELARWMGIRAREFILRERNSRDVIPRVDFTSVYSRARTRFTKRTGAELIRRSIGTIHFAARHAARQVLGPGRSR